MRLFDLINNKLSISEEAYILKPFKKVWDRDKHKDKDLALAELGYIYFMEDFKSDFSDIVDEDIRSKEIKESITLPPEWEEDEVVRTAREFYQKRSEEVLPLLMLKDAKSIIDKMRVFYREVDFLATDKHGKPKYDIDKVARVIERSATIIETLTKLENMIKKEIQSKKDMVGSKKKSTFEDGM